MIESHLFNITFVSKMASIIVLYSTVPFAEYTFTITANTTGVGRGDTSSVQTITTGAASKLTTTLNKSFIRDLLQVLTLYRISLSPHSIQPVYCFVGWLLTALMVLYQDIECIIVKLTVLRHALSIALVISH